MKAADSGVKEAREAQQTAAALMSPHKTWGGRPHNYRLRCPTLGYPKWFANIDQLHLHFQQKIKVKISSSNLHDWKSSLKVGSKIGRFSSDQNFGKLLHCNKAKNQRKFTLFVI